MRACKMTLIGCGFCCVFVTMNTVKTFIKLETKYINITISQPVRFITGRSFFDKQCIFLVAIS